jgi:hypothetical protein
MARTKQHVDAIVRIDEFDSSVTLEDMITVKEVVWSIEQAEAEVSRLNELNESKGCRYFWQTTRLIANDAPSDGALLLFSDPRYTRRSAAGFLPFKSRTPGALRSAVGIQVVRKMFAPQDSQDAQPRRSA